MSFDLGSISITQPANAHLYAITGEPTTGKTSFCAGMPSPIFIFTEESRGNLLVPAFNNGVPATSYLEVMQAMQLIHQSEHSYHDLIIDSADHLEHLIWSQVCIDNKLSSIDAASFGKGYTAAMDYWQALMQWAHAIVRDRQMNVVFTCHVAKERYEPPNENPYDRWTLKLHESGKGIGARPFLIESMDNVFFLRRNISVITNKEGPQQKERSKAVDVGTRSICTDSTPAFVAKNRFDLPPELPYAKGQGWATVAAAMEQSRAAALQPAAPAAQPVAPAAQ